MSKTLAFELVIGASLAPSVGSSIKSVEDRLSQLQKKCDALKLGAGLGRSFTDLKQETLEVRQEHEKTGFKSAQLGRVARQERSQLRSELSSTMALGANIFAYPVRTIMNFEHDMAATGVTVGATAEEMKLLDENAREMGRTTQFTASQAAGAQKHLGTAGFDTGEIVASMPGVMNLATAGGLDLGTATTLSTGILNAFGMQKEEMARVGDVLALSAASSGTSIEQMGLAMQHVAPDAAALGMTIEQTAAAISVLSDENIRGERAVTTLQSMMSRIARPTKEAADLLEYLGVTTTDTTGELRELPDILKDMDNAMSNRGFSSGEKSRGMSTVFGQEAGSGATVIAEAANDGKLGKLVEEYNSALGAAEETGRRMMDTTKGDLLILGSAIESVALGFKEVLSPAIRPVIHDVTGLVTCFSTFIKENPTAAKLTVGMAAGFVGLKAASLAGRIGFSHILDGFSLLNGGFQMLRPSTIQAALGLLRMKGVGGVFAKILSPFRSFKTGFMKDAAAIGSGFKWLSKGGVSLGGKVGGAFKSFGGVILSFGKTLLLGIKGLGAALMANPVLLAIGIIVALVAGAAYLIWKHWDKIGAWLSDFWEGIKTRWGAAVEWIGSTVSGLGEAIRAPFASAFQWLDGQIEWVKGLWTDFKSFMTGESPPQSYTYTADGVMIPTLAESHAPAEGAYSRSIWHDAETDAAKRNGSGVYGPAPASSFIVEKGAIEINTQPGMDEQTVAELVIQKIERKAAQRERRNLGDVAVTR